MQLFASVVASYEVSLSLLVSDKYKYHEKGKNFYRMSQKI